MAKQTINVGTGPNTKNGDPIRVAFTKVNQNFTELYGAVEDSIVAGEVLATETYVDTALLVYQQQLEIDGGSASTNYTAEITIDGGGA